MAEGLSFKNTKASVSGWKEMTPEGNSNTQGEIRPLQMVNINGKIEKTTRFLFLISST